MQDPNTRSENLEHLKALLASLRDGAEEAWIKQSKRNKLMDSLWPRPFSKSCVLQFMQHMYGNTSVPEEQHAKQQEQQKIHKEGDKTDAKRQKLLEASG